MHPWRTWIPLLRLGDRVAWAVAQCTSSKRRALALVMFVLFGAGIAFSIGKDIRINTSLKALLPRDAPSVHALDRVRSMQGSTDRLTIAIESKDPEANRRFGRDIAKEIKSWKETSEIYGNRDFTLLRNHALYQASLSELEQLRDLLKREKQAAVIRSTRPGLVDEDIPIEAVLVGENDWDIEDIEADSNSADDESSNQAKSKTSAPDLQQWLQEQRKKIAEKNLFRPYEIDAIWPAENENGKINWPDRIELPTQNEDGTIQIVSAGLSKPATDIQFVAKIAKQTNQAIQDLKPTKYAPDMRAMLVGSYDISRDVDAIKIDLRRATLLSSILVITVVVVSFRSLSALIIIIVPVVVASGFALACAHWIYGELNVLTAFLFAVLFGMGVDFAVHLQVHRKFASHGQHWQDIVREQIRPLFSTAITTIGCLIALTMANFKAFREFGWLSAIGVGLSLVVSLFLVPALDILLNPNRTIVSPNSQNSAKKEHVLAKFSFIQHWGKFVALGGLGILAAIGTPKVEFENNTRKLRPPRPASAPSRIHYGDALGSKRTSVPVVLVAEQPEALNVAVERLKEHKQSEVHDGSWIKDAISLQQLLPKNQSEKSTTIKEIYQLSQEFLDELEETASDDAAQQFRQHLEILQTLSKQQPIREEELPSWITAPFRTTSGETKILGHAYLKFKQSDISEVRRTVDKFRDLLSDLPIEAAASSFVFADLAQAIELDTGKLPLISLALILLIITVDLRKSTSILLCFGSLAGGLAVALGMIGLSSIHINFFNLAVMPAVVGLGIDTSLHLWHARKSPRRRATSRASMIAALTTIAAFSGLLIAQHPGLRSMAELGILAIASCVGVALLVHYRPGS